MYLVPANVYGLDFLASYPDPQLLWDRGIRFVAIYLKNWKSDWVARAMEIGIAIVPIGEVAADSAAGGASLGVVHATRWVTAAKQVGIPANSTVPIVMTDDTSAWSQEHVNYFKAAEPIIRKGGYLFGGYGSKQMVTECEKAGIVWDLIWATNAYAWGGGRYPNAHAYQGGHNNINVGDFLSNGHPLDVTGMGAIDTNVSRRPFPAWSTQQQTNSKESDMPVVVTNKEVFFTSPPNVAKFVIRAEDGKLRHILEPEWNAMGSPAGYAFTNAQIVAQGVWAGDPAPAQPCKCPTTLHVTLSGEGTLS